MKISFELPESIISATKFMMFIIVFVIATMAALGFVTGIVLTLGEITGHMSGVTNVELAQLYLIPLGVIFLCFLLSEKIYPGIFT